MKFKQYENGSCDIEFSKKEVKIISKKKSIHLSEEALRHFGNNLVKIVADWQVKFSEEVKNKMTTEDTEIVTNSKVEKK
jgi:hypothetical protein